MKKTILILTGCYLPGFKAGGPVRSIAGLVSGLGDEYEFKIVTGDRDLGDERPYVGEPVGQWYEYGLARVLRIPPGARGTRMILGALRGESYDVLYINSVCDRTYSILPLIWRRLGVAPRRPVVVAPRGEFSNGALGSKTGRKWAYVSLATMSGMFEGVLWQASSEHEKKDIMRVLGQAEVRKAASIAARDGVIVAADVALSAYRAHGQEERVRKEPGKLRVVTLGRVCRMKNVEYAIGLFKNVKGTVEYDVYGPLEGREYVDRCKMKMAELPENVTVRLMGGIQHEKVASTLSGYHVFLLPSLGENFGHVVVEGMSAGCVPIVSDRTPWRKLQEVGAGWDLALSEPGKFEDALRTAVAWGDDEFRRASEKAREYAAVNGSYENATRENKMLFEIAAGMASRK